MTDDLNMSQNISAECVCTKQHHETVLLMAISNTPTNLQVLFIDVVHGNCLMLRREESRYLMFLFIRQTNS